MKNLFFALVLSLGSLTSFASDSNLLKASEELDQRLIYETSCGETVVLHLVGDKTTFTQLMDAIGEAEEWLCD